MPSLICTPIGADPVHFAADLVVFDKDGTLIDFHTLWAQKVHVGVEALVQAACTAWQAPPRGERALHLQASLYRALGYDEGTRSFAPQGPVVTAAMETLYTIAATVLYQQGLRGGGELGWVAADQLVRASLVPAMDAAFGAESLRLLAGARAAIESLHAAGVAVAVITSDDEAPARKTLNLLGLDGQVRFVAGGDSGYGHKPAPDALLAACAALQVAPARTAMLGDTTADLIMATRAGAGLRVGLTTGFVGAAVLAPHADVVLGSLEELRVA